MCVWMCTTAFTLTRGIRLKKPRLDRKTKLLAHRRHPHRSDGINNQCCSEEGIKQQRREFLSSLIAIRIKIDDNYKMNLEQIK